MRTSSIAVLIAAVSVTAFLSGLVRPAEAGNLENPREQILGDLTLEQAITHALLRSPSLAAGTHAVSAAEARITQAGLYPNPELEIEAENIGGSGDLRGFESAENTVRINQPIILGGKRGHRRAVAESEHVLAGRDRDALRLDVITGTTSAFYRVLAAQQHVSLAQELLGLAERFAATVQARVDAGKVSPVGATRAAIEVAQARVRLARAKRELLAGRALLASTWGSPTAAFDEVLGELPEPTPPPTLQQLRPLLMEAPEIVRLDEQIERGRRNLELERSLRIPDLTMSVGPRRFEDTGQSAWVAGLSLPIPIFDRNQGSRMAAEFELERTRRDAEAVRVAIEAEIAAALERIHAATMAAVTMDRDVVPAATAVLAATEKGYREGKFGLLEVLDAQRALFDARSILLDSREEYAMTLTELERLVGRDPIQGDQR